VEEEAALIILVVAVLVDLELPQDILLLRVHKFQ
jgi:hypothetical protein